MEAAGPSPALRLRYFALTASRLFSRAGPPPSLASAAASSCIARNGMASTRVCASALIHRMEEVGRETTSNRPTRAAGSGRTLLPVQSIRARSRGAWIMATVATVGRRISQAASASPLVPRATCRRLPHHQKSERGMWDRLRQAAHRIMLTQVQAPGHAEFQHRHPCTSRARSTLQKPPRGRRSGVTNSIAALVSWFRTSSTTDNHSSPP